MNIFPRPPDTWSRACFRVIVGCALALLFAFFAIRSAEEAPGAYRNGYWSIFRKWEEITRAIIVCFWAGADLAYASAQSSERQFLSMWGLLGWLLAFLISILCWRRDRRQVRYCALIAPLVCLVSCAGMSSIGGAVRRGQFERQLPRYQALVDQMEAGSIPVSLLPRSVALPESDRDLAYGVLAQKDTNGLVTVEFMTGRGFPVIHSGYLYVSSGAVQPGSVFDSRWRAKTPIKQKWFRISD